MARRFIFSPAPRGRWPQHFSQYLILAAVYLALALHNQDTTNPAQLAYVGPGAGFAFLGSFLSLLLGLILGTASLLAWPFRVLWGVLTGRRRWNKARIRKLIFVGLDGFDPRLAETLMEKGKLPNFARLREEGSFRRLRTTFPALSPVAWSTFATGVSPGKHNIFDFLNRDLRSYLPELSSCKVRPPRRSCKIRRYRLPLSQPAVEMRRKSQTFWKILGRHGIPCTILRVPITFPPERFNGKLLAAMCTPDLLGTQGSFTHFTTAKEVGVPTGGRMAALTQDGTRLSGTIEGPQDPFCEGGDLLRVPFSIILDSDHTAKLQMQRQSYQLRVGEYSPWIKIVFRASLGLKIRGICQFLLTGIDPEISLYLSPINIDPEYPALPISQPSYYSAYLAKLLGTYSTLGMAEDTWALNERVIDEQAFLNQAYQIYEERKRMFFNALDRTPRGVVACVFDTTDRIQHMFWHQDNGVIEELYERMDQLLGEILPFVDDQSVLFVLSDHGFTAFDRCVNLNTWLYENGYLALQGDVNAGKGPCAVDWSRTRAYVLGLSGIYINKKGREAKGIVSPGPETEALQHELTRKLSGLRDNQHGRIAINRVVATSAMYRGPYLDAGPDLLVGYNDGYRTSWDAALGKISAQVFEDNRKTWRGDHCMDPQLVPGVLFSNRKVDAADPGLEDLAPTAISLFGLTPPAYMEGKSVCNRV